MKNLLATCREYFASVSPQKFFALTALLFGIPFILITPPFQAPDEVVHFYRTYQISKLNLTEDKKGDMVGGKLPDAVVDTVRVTSTEPSISFHPNYKYVVGKTKQALHIKENPKPDKFYDFASAALYPPIAYLPQAIAMALADLVGIPPIGMLYAARTASLATWVVLVGVSIKLLPRKKWALAFIGLIPMAISQAASVSADPVSIGLFILFFTYILHFVQAKKLVTLADKAKITGLAVVMTLCKQVSFVFLPLIFLLQKNLFESKKRELLFKSLVVILPVLVLGLWMYLMSGADTSSSYQNSQDPVQQIKFIILNPHSYINVLFNTYFFTWGDTITRSFIGSFGWVDTPLSETFVVIGYVGLFFVLFANYAKEKIWLSKWQKIVIAAVFFLYLLGVSTALYAFYNPPEFKIITGIQGRYFLPLAVLVIPLLYSQLIKVSKVTYKVVAMGLPIFLLFVSVITIYFRYYINNV